LNREIPAFAEIGTGKNKFNKPIHGKIQNYYIRNT